MHNKKDYNTAKLSRTLTSDVVKNGKAVQLKDGRVFGLDDYFENLVKKDLRRR